MLVPELALSFKSCAVPLLLALMLSSCARVERQSPPATELSSWQAIGKIGFRGENKSVAVNFRWQQDNEAFSINMFGPLGVGRVIVNGNKTELSLIDAQGNCWDQQAATSIMEDNLGWFLPPSVLPYWLLGKPDPRFSVELLEAKAFQQGPWKIQTTQLTQTEKSILPKRLLITRPDVKVTVVIRNWSFKPIIVDKLSTCSERSLAKGKAKKHLIY